MSAQQWVVTTELDRSAEDLEDDDLVDEIIEDLHDTAPALAASADGWLEITITLPANSLQQALNMALARIQTHGEPTMLTAMPESVRDAHEGIPEIPELLTMPQAAQILGVSRQAVVDMHTSGKLRAVQVGPQRVTTKADVEALAKARAQAAARRRTTKPSSQRTRGAGSK